MKKVEILAKVNDVFRDIFENDEIIVTMETQSKDVEDWDSLAHAMLFYKIEETFNIKFSLNEMLNFKNVGDAVNCIKTKV